MKWRIGKHGGAGVSVICQRQHVYRIMAYGGGTAATSLLLSSLSACSLSNSNDAARSVSTLNIINIESMYRNGVMLRNVVTAPS